VISFVRVDNRLIHGQVVEAWLPHLKVSRVVVADDEAAQSPLMRAAMSLALAGAVEVQIASLNEVDFATLSKDTQPTLVLLRDVPAAAVARGRGLPVTHLNLGNVHFGSGRRQVSPSVYLSAEDVRALEQLGGAGAEVEARGVPSDRPVRLPEILERFGKAA
jgi:PTS system mannose-specific IIB component